MRHNLPIPLLDARVAYAGLLQNDVGEIAGFDVRINWKFVIVDGAVPDLVVSLSRSVVTATVPHQNFFDLAGIARHLCGDRQPQAIFLMVANHDFEGLGRIDLDMIELNHFWNQDGELGP
jgi:hypothetical protein